MSARIKLAALLASIFAVLTSNAVAQIVPPVDLSKPVTNPRLVEAILKHQKAQRNDTAAALFEELQRSVFLVGVILEKPLPEASRGGALFKKGEKFGIIEVRDNNDSRLLALFTDHGELSRFTTKANSTFVMPTKQALAFVLEKGYSGAVVNPASEATLRLDSSFIRKIIGQM